MNDSAESKNPARAAAMAKVWAARRAWAMAPTCCCGCEERLEIATIQGRQKFFRAGHDGRLHAFLRKVLRGEVSRQDIPLAARANLARIKFIQADPELKKAFANPGQKALRQRRAQKPTP